MLSRVPDFGSLIRAYYEGGPQEAEENSLSIYSIVNDPGCVVKIVEFFESNSEFSTSQLFLAILNAALINIPKSFYESLVSRIETKVLALIEQITDPVSLELLSSITERIFLLDPSVLEQILRINVDFTMRVFSGLVQSNKISVSNAELYLECFIPLNVSEHWITSILWIVGQTRLYSVLDVIRPILTDFINSHLDDISLKPVLDALKPFIKHFFDFVVSVLPFDTIFDCLECSNTTRHVLCAHLTRLLRFCDDSTNIDEERLVSSISVHMLRSFEEDNSCDYLSSKAFVAAFSSFTVSEDLFLSHFCPLAAANEEASRCVAILMAEAFVSLSKGDESVFHFLLRVIEEEQEESTKQAISTLSTCIEAFSEHINVYNERVFSLLCRPSFWHLFGFYRCMFVLRSMDSLAQFVEVLIAFIKNVSSERECVLILSILTLYVRMGGTLDPVCTTLLSDLLFSSSSAIRTVAYDFVYRVQLSGYDIFSDCEEFLVQSFRMFEDDSQEVADCCVLLLLEKKPEQLRESVAAFISHPHVVITAAVVYDEPEIIQILQDIKDAYGMSKMQSLRGLSEYTDAFISDAEFRFMNSHLDYKDPETIQVLARINDKAQMDFSFLDSMKSPSVVLDDMLWSAYRDFVLQVCEEYDVLQYLETCLHILDNMQLSETLLLMTDKNIKPNEQTIKLASDLFDQTANTQSARFLSSFSDDTELIQTFLNIHSQSNDPAYLVCAVHMATRLSLHSPELMLRVASNLAIGAPSDTRILFHFSVCCFNEFCDEARAQVITQFFFLFARGTDYLKPCEFDFTTLFFIRMVILKTLNDTEDKAALLQDIFDNNNDLIASMTRTLNYIGFLRAHGES